MREGRWGVTGLPLGRKTPRLELVEEKPAPEPLYLDFAYSLHPLRFDGPEGESLWKVGLAFHLDDDEEFTSSLILRQQNG